MHIGPYLIFSGKRKELIDSPLKSIKRIIGKIFGSMSFMTGFVMVVRASICLMARTATKWSFKSVFIMSLFVTAGSLLEDIGRVDDYSIYTLPRVIEGFWEYFKHFGYVVDVPYGMNVIFAISVGLLLTIQQKDGNHMPTSYNKLINFIFGNQTINKKNPDSFQKS